MCFREITFFVCLNDRLSMLDLLSYEDFSVPEGNNLHSEGNNSPSEKITHL